MLTIEERRQLKNLLELLNEEEETVNNRDVSNRSRDEKGRFLPKEELVLEESPSHSARKIKLVKMKGTYGSYFVHTKRFTDGEKDFLLVFGFLVILSFIF
ncbi:hypothetical protein [Bacillus badius]|uniref:Uncharacterized protein n=1 Tax=Bacillus badius TaxID=1455 RepID=A0ABR5ANH4_BACBA|nr:hypothetical protein [Bacillus badius]KIL71974.1 hypothetical protein SD77_3603 [Bacillus badius]